ncbi:MAG TPA: rhodanese-like domain-containing protein [Eoetvoesiella sp.]
MVDSSLPFQTGVAVGRSALVTTDWLQRNLGAPKMCVIEATLSGSVADKASNVSGNNQHIPGAFVLDLNAVSEPASLLPNTLPQAHQFSRHVGELGIDNDTFVVIYDAQGVLGAARAWWMFQAFGHTRVAVLDGGLSKWIQEQRPLGKTAQPQPPQGRGFHAGSPASKVRTFQQVNEAVRSSGQIVDARSAGRFQGLEDEPRSGLRKGHIPGSINLPYTMLLDSSDGTFLSSVELAAKFQAVGADLELPVICSCGSGVSACVLALALHEVGKDDVSVYDGSWSEWGAHSEAAIETGPHYVKEKTKMIYELKKYTAHPGKYNALTSRFVNKTLPVFKRLGIKVTNCWVSPEEVNVFFYLTCFPSEEARIAAWDAFAADEEWRQIKLQSEVDGPMLAEQSKTLLVSAEFFSHE